MTAPYYVGAMSTLFLGDAREVLPHVATESVDLIATDPPYGKEWRSNMRAERFDQLVNDGAADREGVATVMRECVRIVGQSRHLYVFGPTDVLAGTKVSEACTLIWDKRRPGMGDLAAIWGPAHEPITFAISKHRHAGKTGAPALPVRMRKGSVLHFGPPTGRTVRHPSEKPVPLMRELIESSTRQGDTVVDPFAGVCSTGVAAVLCGRRTILCEIDERWAEIGAARLAKAEALAEQAIAA